MIGKTSGHEMIRKFSCISECSDCCKYREYYPSTEYGKIGVLILPDEKQKIERYAREMGLVITILPRLGIGLNRSRSGPRTIIAYQLMGKEFDGNICPFLNLDNKRKSPHGGLLCKIYDKKPIACTAYPVNHKDKRIVTLDSKCKYCKVNNGDDMTTCSRTSKYGLETEIGALVKIQRSIHVDEKTDVWRYATQIGEQEKQSKFYPRGWVLQHEQ
jgi:Fe-S-cluster containining protein